MLKKKFIIIVLLFLPSCGYEAMYSQKNVEIYNFSLTELSYSGDRIVNIKLDQKLKPFKKQKKKSDNLYRLQITSKSNIEVITKDSKGDPSAYENTVTVNANFMAKGKTNNLDYNMSFKYDHIEDRIELQKYEREIIFNLSENIANDLLFDLSNLNAN